MNKQQMAEWLAKNVLGWTFKEGENPIWECPENKFTHGPDQYTEVQDHKLCELIYSPDGFFAVWDTMNKDTYSIKFSPPTPHYEFWLCHFYERDDFRFAIEFETEEGHGETRCEALYKAVYEKRG